MPNNAAAPPLLQMQNLQISARHPRTRHTSIIVQDLSLTLAAGQTLGLIGESGAGKSTLGLAALAHTRDGIFISGGKILVDGQDILRASPSAQRHLRGGTVAYVAQSAAAAFNPARTIAQQLLEAATLHGQPRKDAQARMTALFAKLGLPQPHSFGHKYPHQASGGQLQRAMTAMALITRPKLVVFDEPTTALDVTTQLETLAAIKQTLRSENAAALYISHDLAVVAQIADHILVLRHGKAVESAPATQLLSAPAQPYTRQLLQTRRAQKPAAPPPSAAAPLLAIATLSAQYGATPVLQDISADLHPGRTLAVVGESGSGKSTLARVICGLLPPAAGHIQFAGAPLPPALDARPAALRRQIQMVHQSPDTALNPRNSVQEILGRVLALCGGKKADLPAATKQLLQQVELEPDLLRRRPPQLSGGQKQRVAIARALATRPRLIICDEATSALDALVAEEILKLLQTLQQQRGLAYLFITHDISIVRAMADDILVMRHGRAVAYGPRDQVLNPPHDPYTQLLLDSVPEMRPGWLEQTLSNRQACA